MVDKTEKMTKRAKWSKIKKELLKLPRNFPEIKGIVISVEFEAIIIIVEPVGITYKLSLYDAGRKLEYKFDINFARFEVFNLDNFPEGYSWKERFDSKFKIIYDR